MRGKPGAATAVFGCGAAVGISDAGAAAAGLRVSDEPRASGTPFQTGSHTLGIQWLNQLDINGGEHQGTQDTAMRPEPKC